MIVRKIALNGWRNYEFAAAEFSPGTNVITGENAQGKTNLLEAVYLLTGGKSFRTRFDKELIGFGYTSAEVLADVFAFGREQTVRIVLRQGQRKQIWQNGVKKTAAELAGNFAAVLFCPDDLNIIRDGPRGLRLAAEHRGSAHPRRLFRRARQIDPRLPHGQHRRRRTRHGKRDLLRPVRPSGAAPPRRARQRPVPHRRAQG